MSTLCKSLTILVLFCVALIHGVSTSTRRYNPNLMINLREASIGKVRVSVRSSSPKHHYQKIQENIKRLETSLEEVEESQNLTRSHIANIEKALKEINASKSDGRWSEWSPWSACSAECGDGNRTRTRICMEPINGGKPCEGRRSEWKSCNNKCPVVDGRWSEWSEWSDCSVKCGDGIATRTRTCTGPANGGKPCQGNDAESKPCNECPEVPRKLAISFSSTEFKVKYPHTSQHDYHDQRYVYVNDSQLSDTPTFLEIRGALDSVFINATQIRKFIQPSGYIRNGDKMVEVTSDDDSIIYSSYYCDTDGNRYNIMDLDGTSVGYFYADSQRRPMMSGGDCRTKLWISD